MHRMHLFNDKYIHIAYILGCNMSYTVPYIMVQIHCNTKVCNLYIHIALTISLILHKPLDLLRSAQVLLYITPHLLHCCFSLQFCMAQQWQMPCRPISSAHQLNTLKDHFYVLPQLSKTQVTSSYVPRH